jgi:cytochrome c oxidase assembly factor CtaG
MNLELILTIVAGLVGLPALWSVVIDLLKYFGVVTDGTAGKWSAGFNIVTLIAVAVLVNFFPNFDFAGVDSTLAEVAKFAALIAGYLFQILITNKVHAVTKLYSFGK